METKDTYHFGDLVFGLRGEYQKHEENLRLLKPFCKSEKSVGDNFHFFVHQLDEKEPELHCSYSKKQNLVQDGISKIKNLFIGVPEGVCRKGLNGYYYIEGFPRKLSVCVRAPISFTNMASEILDSEFVQKIKLQKANELGYIRSSDQKGILSFSFGNVRYFQFRENYPNAPLDYSAIYDAYKDTLLVTAFDRKLSLERVQELLEVEFPKERLDSYHVDSIHSSGILEKTILLDQMEPCNMAEYTIFEDKENLTIKKRMSK